MDGNIDKIKLAISLQLLKLGDGHMGVHYTLLVTLYLYKIMKLKAS